MRTSVCIRTRCRGRSWWHQYHGSVTHLRALCTLSCCSASTSISDSWASSVISCPKLRGLIFSRNVAKLTDGLSRGLGVGNDCKTCSIRDIFFWGPGVCCGLAGRGGHDRRGCTPHRYYDQAEALSTIITLTLTLTLTLWSKERLAPNTISAAILYARQVLGDSCT